jgi:membrane protease YdiL (CAAX protease family)
MSILWNPTERRLRAGWRLLAQAALMVVLGILPILVVAEPLTALHRRGLFLSTYSPDNYDRVINMMIGPLLVLAVIASVVIAARRIDRRSLAELGVRLDPAWWTGLGVGVAVGSLGMAFVFVLEYAMGWIQVTETMSLNATDLSLGFAFAFSVVKVLCVGTYEEFFSRGYQLRNLAEGMTLPWGVVVSSVVFSLLHLTNENATLLSCLGLAVNGLFLAAALLVTGRLSTAIGAHIAWNLVQGAVFGFPVSGDKEGASLIGIQQGGPLWFTGGAFGPEAGVVGCLASLLGIGLLVVWGRRHPPASRASI